MEKNFISNTLMYEFARDLILQKDYSVERAVHTAKKMAEAILGNEENI